MEYRFAGLAIGACEEMAGRASASVPTPILSFTTVCDDEKMEVMFFKDGASEDAEGTVIGINDVAVALLAAVGTATATATCMLEVLLLLVDSTTSAGVAVVTGTETRVALAAEPTTEGVPKLVETSVAVEGVDTDTDTEPVVVGGMLVPLLSVGAAEAGGW